MNITSAWYKVNTDIVDSPALIVYPERIKENILYLKHLVKNISLIRPHVKTHKMLEVVELMLQEGIFKFKCATIAEAEMLAIAGAEDVLLAYQPVGPKIDRLCLLVQKFPGTKFSCLVDNIGQARAIGDKFSEKKLTIEVYIDLNVGMNRTGIKPGEEALDLYLEIDQIEGLKARGLHVYDGHIRDQDFEVRKQKCDAAFKSVEELVSAILNEGKENPVVIAGGSPTFPIHARRGDVECSPGTFIFWDWGYHVGLPELKFKIAALVITRIISIIDKNLICLDLGHKAIAAENPFPRVHFLNLPEAESISQSEEHLVVKIADSSGLSLGDVLYGVPYHICPTCALYDSAYIIDNEDVVSSWKVISRNRSIHI
jgi:D-serine deaminase-like pyridoxal phosphate-dependent protein